MLAYLHLVPFYEKRCKILTNPVSTILSKFTYKTILFLNFPSLCKAVSLNITKLPGKIGNTDNFPFLSVQLVA